MTQKFYITTNTQRRMSLRFPEAGVLPTVDLDLELAVHNHPIATEVILHGLIRGTLTTRTKILSALRWRSDSALFDEYLLPAVFKTLKQNIHAEITDDYIFQCVESYGPEMYGEPLRRRDITGILANTAQALSLHPKPRHIEQAIRILRKSVAVEQKRQQKYGEVSAKGRAARRIRH